MKKAPDLGNKVKELPELGAKVFTFIVNAAMKEGYLFSTTLENGKIAMTVKRFYSNFLSCYCRKK